MSEYDFIDFSNNTNSNINISIDKHLVVILITLFTGYFSIFVFCKMINSDLCNE